MRQLNSAQLEAIRHGEGPLLVVAGAGSGKTTVITERFRFLISQGVEPGKLLALTFTGKAAREMEQRVQAALPEARESLHISTFHSFCYQILKTRHFDRKLLDKVDHWIFLRQRIEKLGLEFYQKLPDPGAYLHDLNGLFSRCQDELVEPEDFEAYVRARDEVLSGEPSSDSATQRSRQEELRRLSEIAWAFRNSRKLLQEENSVSIGSLINETLRLFEQEPELLAEYQEKFRYVLVDEFQDTNLAQIELLRRLVLPPYNITVVGDDDQAIYRFRGASYGSFQLFGELFPGHRTVSLFENYRSTKRILRVAEAVISQNGAARYAEKKPLQTPHGEGAKVFLVNSPDYRAEADWIAGEIERLKGQGRPLGEIAVLYRSHSYRDLLVEELRRRNLPFSIRGLSVLSATVLRDLHAYLDVILRPHSNISLIRILLMPKWRLPEDWALELRRRAGKNRRSLFSEILKEENTLWKADLEKSCWSELKSLLRGFKRRAERQPVTELVEGLVDRLQLRLLPHQPDHRYIKAFFEFLKEWEEKSETRKLAEFMEYLDYFRQAGGKIDAPEPTDPSQALQLMTIHSAKGLEFPVVFILGVAGGRFPHRFEKSRIEFPAELVKGPIPPGDFHLQEETRLFYVALTRAKERLYISGMSKPRKKPSWFVEKLLSNGLLAGKDLEQVDAPPLEPAPADGSGNGAARADSSTSPQPTLVEGAGKSPYFYADVSGWAAEDLPQLASEKLLLSASAVETYKTCPLKFKLGHYSKVPTGPHPALTFGNIMHVCVKRYFELRGLGELRKSKTPTFEEMKKIYESQWRQAGFEDRYQEEAYKKAGLEQLRGFCDEHRDRDIKPLALERRFSLDLGDIILEGRIDQINALGNGAVELVDYKTGTPQDQKKADQSLQLSLYALAARRELKLDPERLTFYNLTSNEAVSAIRTEKDLEKAQETLREVAGEIRQRHFDPKPGYACKFCDYYPICPAQERNP